MFSFFIQCEINDLNGESNEETVADIIANRENIPV